MPCRLSLADTGATMGNRPAASATCAAVDVPVAANGWASEEYPVEQCLRSPSITGVIQTAARTPAKGRLRMRIDAEALVFLDEDRTVTLVAFPFYSIMCWGEHGPAWKHPTLPPPSGRCRCVPMTPQD